MANRFTVDRVWSFYKGLTLVRARILMSGTTPVLQDWQYPAPNSGTAGAYVTAQTSGAGAGGFGPTAGSEGVKTVARTGAGLWTFVLQDNYNRLLDLSVHQSLAGGAGTIVAAHEDTSISSMTSAGGSIIGVGLISATATLADPATTTIVTINMVLQNSSAP